MPAMPPLDRLTRVGSRASLQSSAKSGEQAMEPAAKSGFGGYNVVGWLNGQAKAQVGYEFDGGETSWGLWVSGPMEELLEGLCRMSCLGISDFLDSRFEGVRKGTDVSYDTGSFGGIIFATRPVSSALRRLPLKVFLLAASVYLFYSSESARAVFDSELGKDFAFGPFEHYRLETLLTRNGTEGTQLAGPGVSAFGVIGSSGCSPAGSWDQDKTLPPPISSLAGTSMLATYPGGVRMLGWYMNTGKTQGSEALDPAFFNVWATNDDIEIGDGSCARGKDVYPWWKMADDQETRWCGARWTRVGAPRWRHRTSTYWDFVHTTVELPEARGSEGLATFLLMTPRQSYFVYWLWGTYPWAAGCLLSVLAATLQPYIVRARGFIPPPYLILWSGITASIVMSLTQLVVELQEGGMKSVALEIAMALTSSTTMSIVVFTQGFKGHMFLMLVVGSVVENLQWAVCCYIFWHDPMARISVPGLFFIILSVALLLFRQKAVWKSKRLLREHKIMYDETWNAIWASGEETRKELLNLQTLTEQLLAGSTLHTTGVRQYNRRRVQTALSRTGSFFSRTPSALSRTPSAPSRSPSAAEEYPGRVDNEPIHPLFLDIGLVTQPGVADPKSRIECFSQIYCQAAIANLLLMDRIKDWAEQSDGIFRDKVDGESEATFVRWRAVKGDAGGTQVVDRASTLKGHKRCIEKLLRVYHDDFSHLMDISRSCIVFSTIKALNECLQAIADDDDVVVERVKNRYHPDYDSEATAGYRDVCINLRLVSSQAKALGAELFVCEVQLQLLDFARLKTNGSHKRYVEARQSRGT
uniref:Uncharacterized protein n=1 Tax=Hemiselmis andersenii TaxID=464988 RepID=A0A6T8PCN9_HEMAN